MGSHTDRQYNDLEGVAELTNLPDDAFHRNVDKVVLEAGAKNGDVLKTCIVCPPTIYGMLAFSHNLVPRAMVYLLLTNYAQYG